MSKYLTLIFASLVALFTVGECLKAELLREEYERLGTKFDFYDGEFQDGLSTHIETDGPCKNLPKRWYKRAMSVDTRGTCGKVCSEKDCLGECTLVVPNVGDQQLSTIKWAKKIVSIQGCFHNA